MIESVRLGVSFGSTDRGDAVAFLFHVGVHDRFDLVDELRSTSIFFVQDHTVDLADGFKIRGKTADEFKAKDRFVVYKAQDPVKRLVFVLKLET